LERVHLGSYESVGKDKMIHAKERFEVRCGKTTLVMEANGNITIDGVNIRINGKRIDLGPVDKLDSQII
jgi:type VI secretion system secreted protein VgrG